MYICKSAEKTTIAQMEIPDFFSLIENNRFKRKIILDLDNDADLRYANKVLRPKGLEKRVYRKKKFGTHHIQSTIFDVIPQSLKNKTGITKFNSIQHSNSRNIALSSTSALQELNKQNQKRKKIRNELKEKKQEIQEKESLKKDNNDKMVKKKLKDNTNAISHAQGLLLSQKPLISEEKIEKFATGEKGSRSFTVQCPFCLGDIEFSPDDLEGIKDRNTHICDTCDAIARISSIANRKSIFKNLNIEDRDYLQYVKKVANKICDDYGAPIYTYAFQNE